MSRSLRRMMTKTATTKKPATMSGNNRSGRTSYLTGVRCLPPDPVDPRNDIVLRLGLDSPTELYQTVCENVDIQTEHTITIDSVEYVVRGVGPFDGDTRHATSEKFKVLYLEREKRGV